MYSVVQLPLKEQKLQPIQREMAMVVTACMSALANGKISLKTRTFLDESQNLTWVRSSTPLDLRSRFCFTEMTGATISTAASQSPDPRTDLFNALWASPIPDPGASPLQRVRLEGSMSSDSVLAEKLKLCTRVRALCESSIHVDYVPSSVQQKAQFWNASTMTSSNITAPSSTPVEDLRNQLPIARMDFVLQMVAVCPQIVTLHDVFEDPATAIRLHLHLTSGKPLRIQNLSWV